MELWQGELPDFIESARSPVLVQRLVMAFKAFYKRPPQESEVLSWKDSLAAVADVADEGATTDDVGVLVEYHLPLSERRIDVMFFGQRHDGRANSLLLELKRWDAANLEDEHALNVLIGKDEHVHPSEQALDYAEYLRDTHSAFVDDALDIQPAAYCHNMTVAGASALQDPRFNGLLARSPLYIRGDEARLAEALGREVGGGHGVRVMETVRAGQFKPSKRIIDSLVDVLTHDDEWHLLQEQRLAFNAIWAEVARLRHKRSRSSVLVRGGPGTGKSVIAVQLLAEALKAGMSSAHVTGGKAFTTVMRGTFSGSKGLFKWNKDTRNAPPMGLDLLLVDEAHRIRETSDTRFTSKAERNRDSQVNELINAAKVSVFFLDEHQYMRPDEIGSTSLIRRATATRDIPLKEYDLASQFRCGGSRAYVNFVNHLLGFPAPEPESFTGQYAFDLAGDPYDLENVLDLGDEGASRLVASFCWPWRDPNEDGTLVNDVVIGSWSRPWNRKAPENKTYKDSVHPYTLWATTAEGEGQVGCTYSAQGFEFERVGVIWGEDLVWRDGAWIGRKKDGKRTVNYDPGLRTAKGDNFTLLLRHAYRVLLTRGIKGTRLLCLDDETRQHIADVLAATNRVIALLE
ncbi:MAG: DNA/RNA helicase domain-containing protein [Vicinamibacterales bacterium]